MLKFIPCTDGFLCIPVRNVWSRWLRCCKFYSSYMLFDILCVCVCVCVVLYSAGETQAINRFCGDRLCRVCPVSDIEWRKCTVNDSAYPLYVNVMQSRVGEYAKWESREAEEEIYDSRLSLVSITLRILYIHHAYCMHFLCKSAHCCITRYGVER